ncbi:MAG: 50S ribosomal protein L23 [Leptospiraceae bacterium]|nr:50S ribosomal protein L23 [Leptospiraceae bacterium]
MHLENVIISPLLTEKSQQTEAIGEANQKRMKKYTFRIHPDANKIMVKQAIFKMFQIKPDSVNIVNCRGKNKKFRNIATRGPRWKKAIVTFNNGAELQLTKGA